jgi:hypothetical protein
MLGSLVKAATTTSQEEEEEVDFSGLGFAKLATAKLDKQAEILRLEKLLQKEREGLLKMNKQAYS